MQEDHGTVWTKLEQKLALKILNMFVHNIQDTYWTKLSLKM